MVAFAQDLPRTHTQRRPRHPENGLPRSADFRSALDILAHI